MDYVQYDRYALLNRETGFIMILIICNSTIGYPGGYERSYWLRTPELAIRRCCQPSACARLPEYFSYPQQTIRGIHEAALACRAGMACSGASGMLCIQQASSEADSTCTQYVCC